MAPNPKLDPAADPDVDPATGEAITETVPGAPAIFDMKQLGDAIAEGITRTQPRRALKYGEYKPLSAQQPDKTKSTKLTHACYQNGGFMNPARMTNREIALLNQIHRSGRYIDRIVEVIIGRDGSDDAVDFRYNDKSIDQRMTNKSSWRSLEHMLEQIVAEQTRLDEIDEERLARPFDSRPIVDTAKRPASSPSFGQSEATRKARERAGVA